MTLLDAVSVHPRSMRENNNSSKLCLIGESAGKPRWREHLPHARATLWTLIADNNEVALGNRVPCACPIWVCGHKGGRGGLRPTNSELQNDKGIPKFRMLQRGLGSNPMPRGPSNCRPFLSGVVASLRGICIRLNQSWHVSCPFKNNANSNFPALGCWLNALGHTFYFHPCFFGRAPWVRFDQPWRSCHPPSL